ncbi:flagellar biosynthetic protein FliO [Leptospira perolatii]|uniref:Flagellar biosynthetic protein FliO n=1 Tax=Leptospira perolatii TaxID=2023191 RepID=A0A2M9ZMH1_9LEPT|nr:flagellar biosynthetic protein FliO [Leptospira perolatii]PJZ70026.1 flagellar biosynthetic protein FliO [Leptospira perolatii]PJZ73214.1 flagellar biosynthetic protein FliO [Leptospira perolatii]
MDSRIYLSIHFKSGIRALAISLLVWLAILGSQSVLAQSSEREAMDEILQKELKGENAKKPNSPENEAKTSGSENNSGTGNQGKNVEGTTAELANPVEERYKPISEGPSLIGILFRIVLVLGVLCGAAFWLLRTVSNSREAKLPIKGEMSLLGSLVLGANKQLQIVEVTGQVFILGVADNGISLISEISDPETKAKIQRMKDEYHPPEGGFIVSVLEQLKDLNTRIGGKSVSDAEVSSSVQVERKEKQKKLKQKLDEIKRERDHLEKGLFDLS